MTRKLFMLFFLLLELLECKPQQKLEVAVLKPAPNSRTVVSLHEPFQIQIRIKHMSQIPGTECHLYRLGVYHSDSELHIGTLCACFEDGFLQHVVECYLDLWTGLLSSSMPELVVYITDQVGAELAHASSTFTLTARNDTALKALIDTHMSSPSTDPAVAKELQWLRGLCKAESQAFSQNTEDGAILEVFNHFGTTNKLAVEFGAEDGSEVNSRRLWEHHGWTAILLDGGYENLALHANATLHKAFITPANIVSLFKKFGVPTEFDLLSVDLDFNDFWVLQRILRVFRPRVVVAEINRNFGPDEAMTVPMNASFHWTGARQSGFPHGTGYFGMSVGALDKLATSRGYKLLYVFLDAVNALLVRNDLLLPAVRQELELGVVMPQKAAGIHALYDAPQKWVQVREGEEAGELAYEEVFLSVRDGDYETEIDTIQGQVRVRRFFDFVGEVELR